MGKFLIEVPREEEVLACARFVEIFLKTGSHFVTHADWGCRDGVHKAWIINGFLPPAHFRNRCLPQPAESPPPLSRLWTSSFPPLLSGQGFGWNTLLRLISEVPACQEGFLNEEER